MVEMKHNKFGSYADVITSLPEADIQSKGIRGWILQGENHQLVFFQMEADARIPEHDHEYAELMILLEGEMELTIEGRTSKHKKGDEVVIPVHAKHNACFLTESRLAALFSERTRYRTKLPA
jgi:quercetin dioxygenase-like cupin family protein